LLQRKVTEQKVTKGEVTWEVEVEAEMVTKLKGSVVGFLSEHRDPHVIQQNFIMDGYPNLKITPLGHLKVLLSSPVMGEVQEVVGSVGWWCTWFDRFEEWSPELVSNQRVSWLSCYGVPLHAWGEALFRSLGFKFGTFVDVDPDTKNLVRGDVARIKVVTELPYLVNSSITISVLEKKFVIRVLEEAGRIEQGGGNVGCRCSFDQCDRSINGSGGGGSTVAVVEGQSEIGSEGDWSESDQELQDVGVQQCRKGCVTHPRLEMGVGIGVSGFVSNSLGNPLVVVPPKVNLVGSDNRDDVLEGSKALVLVHEEADRVLEDVSPVGWSASKEDICVNNPRDSEKVGSRAAGLACPGVDLVPGLTGSSPWPFVLKGEIYPYQVIWGVSIVVWLLMWTSPPLSRMV
jgi:hypothetical protein